MSCFDIYRLRHPPGAQSLNLRLPVHLKSYPRSAAGVASKTSKNRRQEFEGRANAIRGYPPDLASNTYLAGKIGTYRYCLAVAIDQAGEGSGDQAAEAVNPKMKQREVSDGHPQDLPRTKIFVRTPHWAPPIPRQTHRVASFYGLNIDAPNDASGNASTSRIALPCPRFSLGTF